jgi:putative membrane protein
VSVVAQVAAGVAILVHLLVFGWESLLLDRVHQSVFRLPAEHLPAVRLWAFGQGFYNLFLAGGTIAGLVALWNGQELVGRTLVLYTAWFMVLSSIVLAVADQLAMSRPRNSAWGGVVAQGLPALVVLVFA